MAKLQSQSEHPRDPRRAPARSKKSQTALAGTKSQRGRNVTQDRAKFDQSEAAATPQEVTP